MPPQTPNPAMKENRKSMIPIKKASQITGFLVLLYDPRANIVPVQTLREKNT